MSGESEALTLYMLTDGSMFAGFPTWKAHDGGAFAWATLSNAIKVTQINRSLREYAIFGPDSYWCRLPTISFPESAVQYSIECDASAWSDCLEPSQ